MSVLNDILKSIGGAPDDVVNLADKVGLDPSVTQWAIVELARAHRAEGDTIEIASAKTGLDTSVLRQIVEQIGGEGSLTEFANVLEREGESHLLGDLAGMVRGLFGKK
jgi:hypothetical protein